MGDNGVVTEGSKRWRWMCVTNRTIRFVEGLGGQSLRRDIARYIVEGLALGAGFW